MHLTQPSFGLRSSIAQPSSPPYLKGDWLEPKYGLNQTTDYAMFYVERFIRYTVWLIRTLLNYKSIGKKLHLDLCFNTCNSII